MTTPRNYGVTRGAKFLSAALIAIALFGSTPAPANAWWFFFKRKPSVSKVEKKARQLAGVPVGLVAGHPPATYWQAEGKPRATVLCLHELGFYSGAFDNLGSRMAKQGMAVYAIDERGFGGWSSIPGKDSEMDMKKIVQDIKDSAAVIRKLHPDTPLFLLGEAMGGSLVLKVAADNPELVNGVITAAPSGDHHNTTKNYTTITKQIITAGPNESCDYGEQLMEAATPREDLRQAFRSDPQIRLDLAPKELMACQFFMYKTKAMAKSIKNTPVLVVHGEKDGESKESGSADIYEALKTKDKEYLKLPDGDHYTYEDVKVSDAAFDKTLSWIEKHLAL
jgi:alpha-beta hydrolase superfamily lysophospholipase